MATNKERIEALEAGIDGVQTGMQRLEETISRLSEVMLANTESSNHNTMGVDLLGHIKKSLMAAVKFFHPKWQGWNFQNTLVTILLNSSIG